MEIKDINYYMELHYPIEIIEIPKEEGGGYSASIPLLGKYSFIADGDTVNQAIRNLHTIKKVIFTEYLERGTIIPEPSTNEQEKEEYSGKLQLRIPKSLHRSLAKDAKTEGVSLNNYLNYLLTANFEINAIYKEQSSKSMYYYNNKDYTESSKTTIQNTFRISG